MCRCEMLTLFSKCDYLLLLLLTPLLQLEVDPLHLLGCSLNEVVQLSRAPRLHVISP